MPNSKLLPPLIALAALMLVVSATLAAVVLSDSDSSEEPEPTPRAAIVATSPPTSTVAPTTTEVPLLPERLRARFEALPDKLREQALQQLEDGRIGVVQLEEIIESYENRNNSVRVGAVLETDGDSLLIEVYTTGEQVSIAVDEDTVIRRAQQDISLDNLQTDELVMVLSQDEGVSAFSIEAFGVEAP